jgi:hypothetical protein
VLKYPIPSSEITYDNGIFYTTPRAFTITVESVIKIALLRKLLLLYMYSPQSKKGFAKIY